MYIDNKNVFVADIYSRSVVVNFGCNLIHASNLSKDYDVRLVKKDAIILKIQNYYVPLFYIKNEKDLKNILAYEYEDLDETADHRFITECLNIDVGEFVSNKVALFDNNDKSTLKDLQSVQQQLELRYNNVEL